MSWIPELRGVLSDFLLAAKDRQVNVYNFHTLMDGAPLRYRALRFDSNNDCNLHCVYCHNHRSKDTIETNDFVAFLHSKVLSAAYFQVGCIMEPTLDERLADLLLLIAQSPAKPARQFILQTNGLLLHRHDVGKLREAGLTRLSVSLDAADPQTVQSLRDGMSIDRVIRNVEAFRSACPSTSVEFVSTVTSENTDKLSELVELGLGLGVRQFVFRELFYYPDNEIVDHSRMPGLLLAEGEFEGLKRRLRGRFAQAKMYFIPNTELDRRARDEIQQSRFKGRSVPRLQVGS